MADKKDEKDRKDMENLLESAVKEYDRNEQMYSRGKKTKEATAEYEKNKKQILEFIAKLENEGKSPQVAVGSIPKKRTILMDEVAVAAPREKSKQKN
ncbi:MAG: hypothetical protein NTY68_01580 [Candidatus Micrarchaeota archaeon]|nr:hypothetical protein [Candidatus Micrarchaeota archaeon]